MKKSTTNVAFYTPYVMWLALFVIAPMVLIVYQSFFDISGHFTLANYQTYFQSGTYIMTVSYTHLTLPTIA